MHLIMFDIDGTLVQSCDFDSECFVEAVEEVIGGSVDNDWSKYRHVTDSGILDEIIVSRGLVGDREAIYAQVKGRFIDKISGHLTSHGVMPVAGAAEFISLLQGRHDVVVAIATGGWKETALLKLTAAGFDYSNLVLASSSDHSSRMEIMRIAEQRCGSHGYSSKTYFGDALWDKEASGRLGYEFTLVGDRICHHRQIENFKDPEKVFALIGYQAEQR